MKRIGLLFAFAAILFSSLSYAQTTDNKWAVTVGAHGTDFTSKYGVFDGFFDTDDWTKTPPLSKLTVARSISKFIVADFTASVGEIDTNTASIASRVGYDVDSELFINAGLGLRLKLLANDAILKESSFFDPYIRAGVAYQYFDYGAGTTGDVFPDNDTTNDAYAKSNISGQLGVGLNLWITNGFGINIASDYNFVPGFPATDFEINEQLNFFQHTLGLAFRFGKGKDTDGDGLLDKEDKCPEVAGPIENEGCPYSDTDGDSVLDKDDKCPQVAGPIENEGCPVLLLDSDKDGIVDSKDACPSTPGIASATPGCNGCPDTDKDGTCDSKDACPKDAKNECNIDLGALTETVENVYFEFGKNELTADSKTKITEAARILNDGPTANTYWILEGHTDNIGSSTANQSLSQRRADAVKDFIVSNGVDSNRFKSIGYGEELPIRPNSSQAGRDKNRRVEFKIADSNFNIKALKLSDEDTKEQINKFANKIYFEVGSTNLKKASGASLDVIAEYIKISDKTWEVGGHTDNTGGDAANQALSEKRANAVVAYLVGKGVPTSSLTSVGYGEAKPVADNNTIDGRAENRRIEFSVK